MGKLLNYVGEKTLALAGFDKAGEPSTTYFQGKKYAEVHLSHLHDWNHVPDREINFVIIEVERKNHRVRREFYFRTFEGSNPHLCETEKQMDEFHDNVSQTKRGKYRVAGRDLELAIRGEIKGLHPFLE